MISRPFSVLIAALGGEGGGVLADWIVTAASARGHAVQASSIPGVAQRTGATTYYVEMSRSPGKMAPGTLTLAPAPGQVDVVVASELLEAGRAMLGGFVSPEATTLIASTHRIYTVAEKMQMGDGRLDDARIRMPAATGFTRVSLGVQDLDPGVQAAIEQKVPFICFTATGGARMQEGLLSLMQMAKTNAALTRLAKKGLPYISVLTDPTMGGVSAGFAFVGDVVIAEPRALIGFAGPRVIENTVRVTLPEGFQRAEFLQEKGALDFICDRRELRKTVASVLAMLQRQPADAIE